MAEDRSVAAGVPRAERTAPFYADSIPTGSVNDQVVVPPRRLSEVLGCTWSGHCRRLQRHTLLTRHVQTVIRPPADGKQVATRCRALEHGSFMMDYPFPSRTKG